MVPDFNGEPARLAEVFESRPEVLAHNVETVPRIFKRIRPAFTYQRSLGVLTAARDFGLVTKSNLILGLGETPDEVRTALADLHDAGCDIVTITQYLRPSARHHPVERWVQPEEFVEFAQHAEGLGFPGVLAGPLVRSSYRAGRLYEQAVRSRASDAAVPSGATAAVPYVFLVIMAKPRTTAENKAARAQAPPPARPRRRSAAASCGRRSTFSASEDKRLLPYMIGAFVLIVAVSVAVGVLVGGFTMITLIPLGVVLGGWSRSSSSAAAPRDPSTAKPKGKPARRPGCWTTCAASGG